LFSIVSSIFNFQLNVSILDLDKHIYFRSIAWKTQTIHCATKFAFIWTGDVSRDPITNCSNNSAILYEFFLRHPVCFR
jgi:hypothetical protein